MFNWLIVSQSPKNIPLKTEKNTSHQFHHAAFTKKNRGTQWPQEPPSLLSSCCWDHFDSLTHWSQSFKLRFSHKKKPRGSHTWRIIPASKWLITTIYKPFKPFGRGTTRSLGDLINHLLTGMIQVLSMKDSLGFHKDPFLTSWFMK